MRSTAAVILFALGAVLSACDDNSGKPYLAFSGGGFVFNYRIGQAFYGFVAKPQKPLPEGATIEARFEVPQSDEPLVIQQPAKTDMLQYAFKTPPLKGIVKDHKYRVELRVLEAGSNRVLAAYDHSYFTDVDQASLPDKPLVLGPGYERNPDASIPTQPAN